MLQFPRTSLGNINGNNTVRLTALYIVTTDAGKYSAPAN